MDKQQEINSGVHIEQPKNCGETTVIKLDFLQKLSVKLHIIKCFFFTGNKAKTAQKTHRIIWNFDRIPLE